FCPRNKVSPQGNTATLFFKPEDIGTAFHFNISQQSTFSHRTDHRIIGKVIDRFNGDCVCFIWDDAYKCMTQPWETNIYNFEIWRENVPGKPGIAPLPPLSLETIGLRL